MVAKIGDISETSKLFEGKLRNGHRSRQIVRARSGEPSDCMIA